MEEREAEVIPNNMSLKEEFISTVNTYITRQGIQDLMKWLENDTDFYKAPASTRFHCAEPEGLVKHSLHVFKRLVSILKNEYGESWETITGVSMESVAIIALFHDISKVNTYILDFRNVKVDNDWVRVPYYRVCDNPSFYMIYGNHSENSVYFLNNYMVTTHLENLCIRHHMGGKDFSEYANTDKNTTTVFNMCSLALFTHIADMEATFIDEKL